MHDATTPTVRLSARISADLYAMLKRAAALQGRTMTDFVIAAVQDAPPPAFAHRMSGARGASGVEQGFGLSKPAVGDGVCALGGVGEEFFGKLAGGGNEGFVPF